MSNQGVDKLQKLKDMTVILKDTDRNLSVCEDILTAYIQRKSEEKKDEVQKQTDLEKKVIEILDNLKARLLVE